MQSTARDLGRPVHVVAERELNPKLRMEEEDYYYKGVKLFDYGFNKNSKGNETRIICMKSSNAT